MAAKHKMGLIASLALGIWPRKKTQQQSISNSTPPPKNKVCNTKKKYKKWNKNEKIKSKKVKNSSINKNKLKKTKFK